MVGIVAGITAVPITVFGFILGVLIGLALLVRRNAR